MEEAEFLSDRIMILHEGKIKCIGTSLNLKNLHGEGYKINMVTIVFRSLILYNKKKPYF